MAAVDERRRLAVIMFTDIVGYSSIAQRDEGLSLALLDEHNALLRPIFARHDGLEIKTIGDAFLIEFDSAVQAVRCAIDVQRALNDRNTRPDRPHRIDVRIGLHLGDVVRTPTDVLGDGVNIAARIQPVAAPGGICLSQQVLDQVRDKVEYPVQSLKRTRLKHIEADVRLYEVRLPWLASSTTLAERLYDGMRFRIGRLRVVVTLVAALTMAVLIGDMVFFQGIDPVTGGVVGDAPTQPPVKPADPVNPATSPGTTSAGERANERKGGPSPRPGGERAKPKMPTTTPIAEAPPPTPIPADPAPPAPGRSPRDILNERSGGGGLPPRPPADKEKMPSPAPAETDCVSLLAATGGLAGSCSRVERGYYWERTAERVASWGERGVTWPTGDAPLACGAGSIGTKGYTARGPEGGAAASGPGGWTLDVVASRPAADGPELSPERCPADRCGVFVVICSAVPRR
jgi:class 3 adenylate cyclase